MKDFPVDPGRPPANSVGSTSSSLLERARAPGAWERLTSLYCPLVYGWARRAGLGTDDAADMVQEVFLAVVKYLPGFRHDRREDTFRGWLWTITQNKIHDLRRRQSRGPDAVGGSDAHQRLMNLPELQASASNLARPGPLLAHALEVIRSEFEAPSWQAFWEVVVEGRRPGDVALGLGISVNAVYIARSRILRRLRDELGG
jgi:RNA polymerase sigma-70 factor, ECF subfamily